MPIGSLGASLSRPKTQQRCCTGSAFRAGSDFSSFHHLDAMPRTQPELPIRRRLFFRLLLVLLPVLLIGALLEAGLMAKHAFSNWRYAESLPPVELRALIPSTDPELRVEFNPGYRSDTFSVNALGMADEEVLEQRTPGVTRIAIFGDSISANFQLAPRSVIFPTVLETELNHRAALRGSKQRFETLNFGVNSYSILESLRVAQLRLPRFQPDIVIIQLCLNDAVPSALEGEIGHPTMRLKSFDFVVRRLDRHRFKAYEQVDAHYDEQGWENWSRALSGFAELTEGRPSVAVLFPFLDSAGYLEWDYGRLHEGIAQRAKEAPLALLDLRSDFAKAGLIFDDPDGDPIHPTPEGHRLAANRIIEKLIAMGALSLED
jgi:lysophospholipase L1-like esterase